MLRSCHLQEIVEETCVAWVKYTQLQKLRKQYRMINIKTTEDWETNDGKQVKKDTRRAQHHQPDWPDWETHEERNWRADWRKLVK